MRQRLPIAIGMYLVLGLATMPARAGEPSVRIKEAKVVQRTVSETITVYGRVQPAPNAVRTVSLPHAGLVTRVGVRLGQRVRRGALLIELTTAPAARMEYLQARSAVGYAERELARQQRLLQEQLATQAQVDAARKALSDAHSRLKALEAQGANKERERLTAPTDGIITDLGVKQGDRVQANSTALAIATGDRLIAELGVEPEEIHLLKPGTPVTIHSVFVPGYQAHSQLLEIHAMINPRTHLVDALAPIPPNQADHLVLGSYLKADLKLDAHVGTTVPRSAVLQDERGHYVFVVVNGKAKRVHVEVGLVDDRWMEITRGLEPGQSVVSVGNYVLRDGMAVRESE